MTTTRLFPSNGSSPEATVISAAGSHSGTVSSYRWRPYSPLPADINPDIVPGCRLEAILGTGGMGTVYLARQTALERQVAVKVLNRDFADNPDFIARLRQEACILGGMSHPNIVGCHDVIVTRDGASLIMDYLPGHLNGRNIVRMLGPMPEHYAVKVLLAIARALDYAASRSIIHRDVKPENILFAFNRGRVPRNYDELFNAPELRIALCDFGIADALRPAAEPPCQDTAQKEKQRIMGSPLYMAPEQAVTPEKIDCRADIYALGATAYYLLTGHPPFTGDSWEAVMEQKVSRGIGLPRSPNGRLTSEFAHIISRMGKLLPEERYKDYHALLTSLQQVELLHADRAQSLSAFLHGHQHALFTIIAAVFALWLLAYGGVRWYEYRLDSMEKNLPSQALFIGNWSPGISSWRLAPDSTINGAQLLGRPGSRAITLRQPLRAGDRLRMGIAVNGKNGIVLNLHTRNDEKRLLGRITVNAAEHGTAVRLYSLHASGGSAVPTPLDFPDRLREDGWLDLQIRFHTRCFSVWNRNHILGIVHFLPADITDGACLSIGSIPAQTTVRLRNIIIINAKSARHPTLSES